MTVMSIWNKVLVGFIVVAALAFFALAARALKTHQYWRETAHQLEDALEAEQEIEKQLVEGTGAEEADMGLRQVRLAIHALLIDRGRVWRNCTPQQVQAGGNQSVSLSLVTDQPEPHGIPVKAVLHIFEEAEVQQGGHYLGEFVVSGVGENNLQLVPSMKLNDRELKRLQNSKGPWSLYEIMPIDQRRVLADLDAERIKAMFPDASEEEYLADLEAAQAAAESGEEPPRRQLRDYDLLFGEYHRQRAKWSDRMAANRRDLQYLQAAIDDANKQEQFRKDEIDRLTKDLAEGTREQEAVAAHRAALEAKLAEVQKGISNLLSANEALAGEIAKIQLEATRRIDERTRSMAQTSGAR